MPLYRKKPVVIEAVQFAPGEGFPGDVMLFLGDKGVYDAIDDAIYIDTLEGKMKAKRSDMIIKGVQGEFYPCDFAVFEATYERA